MAKAWRGRRITVVFVERVPWGGGAERVVLDIARHLDKRRFRPLVVCLYEGKEAPRQLRKNIPFVKLDPKSWLDLIKPVLSGHLGLGLPFGLELAVKQVQFCLHNLEVYVGSAKHRAMLRLHNLRAAWVTGQLSSYLRERTSKWLGVPYLGQPFVYPRELPPSATLARLRIIRSRLLLRIRLWDLLPARGMGRLPGDGQNNTCHKRTVSLQGRTDTSPPDTGSYMGVATRNECTLHRVPSKAQNCESTFSACIPYVHRRPIDIWRQARLFTVLSNRLRAPAVIVPVMEEAASMVRLALGEGPRARWPYILSTHAWESYYLPLICRAWPGLDVTEETAFFAAACRGARAVLSPCTGCRDDLVEQFDSPTETTLYFPNPVDIESVRVNAEAQLSVPLPASCEGKPLLLHVGRLDPQKRHRLLFEACLCLKERDQNFHLVCLGDGHIRKELEQLIDELSLREHITLLGFVGNPFPYMRCAHALVLSSESESFALVLVEALACGCVPIAVDCPHGPRDVLDGGRGGFLVREDTPEALAQAIHQALHDKPLVAEKLRHGSSWIEQYSLKQIIPRWEMLLSRVAMSHNPPYE